MDSIEWTKITKQMKVIDTGTHWEAAGKLVTFGSRDQRTAQMWLNRRAKADTKGTHKSVLLADPHWFIKAVKNGKKVCKNCARCGYCPNKNKPFVGTCGFKVTKK